MCWIFFTSFILSCHILHLDFNALIHYCTFWKIVFLCQYLIVKHYVPCFQSYSPSNLGGYFLSTLLLFSKVNVSSLFTFYFFSCFLHFKRTSRSCLLNPSPKYCRFKRLLQYHEHLERSTSSYCNLTVVLRRMFEVKYVGVERYASFQGCKGIPLYKMGSLQFLWQV